MKGNTTWKKKEGQKIYEYQSGESLEMLELCCMDGWKKKLHGFKYFVFISYIKMMKGAPTVLCVRETEAKCTTIDSNYIEKEFSPANALAAPLHCFFLC